MKRNNDHIFTDSPRNFPPTVKSIIDLSVSYSGDKIAVCCQDGVNDLVMVSDFCYFIKREDSYFSTKEEY